MNDPDAELIQEINNKIGQLEPEVNLSGGTKTWWEKNREQFSIQALSENKYVCSVLTFIVSFIILLVLQPPFIFVDQQHKQEQQISWLRVVIISLVIAALYLAFCQFML